MIGKISNILGSPNLDNWKNFENMPNYGKIDFLDIKEVDFENFFSEANKKEIGIMKMMVKYGERKTAEEFLGLEFFEKVKKNRFLVPKIEEEENSFKKIFNLI